MKFNKNFVAYAMYFCGSIYFFYGLFHLTPTDWGYSSMDLNFGVLYLGIGYLIKIQKKGK